MSEKLEIRESITDDWDAIESFYPEAFPDEDLLPLVRDLLQDAAVTLSLIGAINSQIVGHAMFTNCGVALILAHANHHTVLLPTVQANRDRTLVEQ